MAWRDVLSAVAMQEPRLRQRIRVDTFRTALVAAVVGLYARQLAREAGGDTESSEAEVTDTDPVEGRPRLEEVRGCLELEVGWRGRDSSDHVVPSSCPAACRRAHLCAIPNGRSTNGPNNTTFNLLFLQLTSTTSTNASAWPAQDRCPTTSTQPSFI